MGLWKSIQLTATQSDFPIFTKTDTPDGPAFSQHEKPFCPKQAWTGRRDQAHEPSLCMPSRSDNNFAALRDFFAMKIMYSLGTAIGHHLSLCIPLKSFWGRTCSNSSYPATSTRLCPSYLTWSPSDQPQAFNGGNGRIRNWPIISSMEALVTWSLSADWSCFFKYSGLSSEHTWMLSEKHVWKHMAEHLKNRIWALH